MKTLFIPNDLPYGTEQNYNALRLAQAPLKKDPQTEMTIFLMADSIVSTRADQKTPGGYYYNVENMLKRILSAGGKVLMCGVRMDVRGLNETALTDGAWRRTMNELTSAPVESDRVLVFWTDAFAHRC